ncbi:diguanylate cyclase [Oscillatoria sp. FACHB-1406]|uniref:diguanylate cyclase domain-containing protein n=1 Tax=Oscillatoria sp. FACHB-1406 TaxID=2692846 RepID=UPI00168647F8|nr:diguanylate cyclase [Oscillatoria sp. FACHB-1406]MBD2576221.1 diguanylate cyclase [Oscillatoria sp. FACHB-1406]
MNISLVNPSKETILIVDRNPDGIESILTRLTEWGYKVRCANTGLIALTQAQIDVPALILLDVEMSDLNGYEICTQLKTNPRTREIPVIFTSALDLVSDKVKAFSVGGVDYIAKPLQIEEVLVRVQNQLSIRNALKLLTAQNMLLVEEIRERQRAEEALRLSEEKFSKAFQASPQPMTITRLVDGCHLEVNEAFCQSMGYAQEEIIGRTAVELDIWADREDRTRLFKQLTMYGAARNFEFESRNRSGALRTALLSAEIIEIDGEKCLLSLSNDITERVQAEAALHKANQELKRLASLDGLTQVSNRRSFDEYLLQEWVRLKEKQLPISLILCDVDHFKLYNDTYGHQAGDACLQKVAQTIRSTLKRQTDLVARYGGEEFAIVLPDTAAPLAAQIAEAIRLAVEGLEIDHFNSTTSDYVTLSLGVVTTVPSPEFSPEALIGVADLTLYEAKKLGRNRAIAENF